MKNRLKSWVTIFSLALSIMACSSGNATESAADGGMHGSEAASPDATKMAELSYASAFDKAQDGKWVQIEGYLQLPGMIFTTKETSQVDVFERPNQRHGRSISASIKSGSCNNCMQALPEKYTTADLKIKDENGESIVANQRVRLQGTLSVNESSVLDNGLAVTFSVSQIEAIPETPIDYKNVEALKIDKTNLLDTTLINVMSYAEGRLTVPSMLFMQDDISLDMAFGDKNLYVNFTFGTGPNQIEDIPENYTKADFKIHDANGKLINLNKPVKVWGIRSRPGKDNSGFLYVEHIEQ